MGGKPSVSFGMASFGGFLLRSQPGNPPHSKAFRSYLTKVVWCHSNLNSASAQALEW
jgi:hypothetical protein